MKLLISKNPNIDFYNHSIIIGDRLDTDIQYGINNHIQSGLVLTGVTNCKTLYDIHNGITIDEPLPTIIFPHVGLLNFITNNK